MTNGKRISSGAPWEDRFGYSRAVVARPTLFAAGTTATMVQVPGFAHPDQLVEVEIDACSRT